VKDGIVIVGPSISNIKCNHEEGSKTTQPEMLSCILYQKIVAVLKTVSY
jgi:hypothetical protein